MINRSSKSKGSAALFILFLAILLSGCASAPRKGAIPVSAKAIAAGDAENGRKLFMGYAHLENEGPPCMGCHSIGDHGLLGGGNMGPNLTDVSDRLTQNDMVSILANSGAEISQVMEPIYTTHPLTETEQADLIVFMRASAGQPETDREWLVVAISLGGFAAAVAFFGILYRNRLRGVRKVLVRDSLKNQ
jgi:mono/diheme cytochrome c family protein